MTALPDLAEIERLPSRLEASTEFLANRTMGLNLIEWNEHSNNFLAAARHLRSLLTALKAERARVAELEAASFSVVVAFAGDQLAADEEGNPIVDIGVALHALEALSALLPPPKERS